MLRASRKASFEFRMMFVLPVAGHSIRQSAVFIAPVAILPAQTLRLRIEQAALLDQCLSSVIVPWQTSLADRPPFLNNTSVDVVVPC